MVKKKSFEEKFLKEKIIEDDGEPSFFHYLTILTIIFLIFFGLYYFFKSDTICEKIVLKDSVKYKCPLKIQNRSGSLEFFSTIEDVRKYNFEVPKKKEVLNTKEFILSFNNYNGSDNGQVSLVSTRIVGILKVFGFKFFEDSFQKFQNISCKNSSIDKKVIWFNPYSNESKVSLKSNGCIVLEAENIEDFIKVGDKFLLSLVE